MVICDKLPLFIFYLKILFFRLFIIFIAISLFTAPNAWSLSEGEFIDLLLKNKRLFEAEQLQVQTKEIDVKEYYQYYGDWKWNIDVTSEIQQANILKTDDKSYNKHEVDETTEISTTFKKKFFSTGAELSFKLSKSNPIFRKESIKTNTPTEDPEDPTIINSILNSQTKEQRYQNAAELTLKIPLLKNRGGIIAQKSYDILELDLQNKKLSAAYKKERILAKYLQLFLKWGFFEKQVYLLERRIKMAQKTLNRAKKRKKYNDILRAKQSLNILLLRLKSITNNINNIKIKLSKITHIALSDKKAVINWNRSLSPMQKLPDFIKQHSFLLKKIVIQQQINQRNIQAYRNSTSPKLDLNFKVKKDDRNGEYISSGYTYLDKEEYSVSLDFSYPLFHDIKNDASLAKAIIKIRQLQIKYEDSFNAILERLEIINNKLHFDNQQLKKQAQQVVGIQKIANKNMNNYLNRRTSITVLVKHQDRWLKTALAHARALFEYHKNILQYNLLLDRLLPEYTKVTETK